MTTIPEKRPSLWRRAGRYAAQTGVVAAILLFYAAYVAAPGVQRAVDLFLDPAVAGIAVGYSALSTFLHAKTGVDIGLVRPETDPEFAARVRMATWINERNAAALIDIAADKRYPDEEREKALRALLKFNSSADWIQPLLNELPKGGLVGLYEHRTPALDALFERVRADGGVRRPLARAYAELVFSFMLQVPDAILRAHAFRWLPDALPEDALAMIAARIGVESDMEVRRSIEHALLNVRAAPNPEAAFAALLPHYKDPPWETLRVPLAAVLARLGDKPAAQFLASVQRGGGLSEAERAAVDAALAGKPFPAAVSDGESEAARARRAQERRDQTRAAAIKRDRLERQERIQRELLASALDPARAPYVGVRPEINMPDTMPRGPAKPISIELGPGFEKRVDEVSRIPETEDAEDAYLEVVEADVPVYAEASPERAVAQLTRGNIVHVLRAVKVSGERWFEVELKDGQVGWIRGDLNLKLAGEDAPAD